MLTPIKIRGKKRCRQSELINHSNRARKPHRNSASSSKYPKSSIFSSFESISSAAAPKTSKKPTALKHLSAIEKLPIELLETILFLSANIALPRASPIIGAKLSSHHVYIHTILRVFGPTWEDRYDRLMRRPFNGDSADWSESFVPGDPIMQTRIVRCRWATLEILMKAEELWLRAAQPFELETVEFPLPLPFVEYLDTLTMKELHDLEVFQELDDTQRALLNRYDLRRSHWFEKIEDINFEKDYVNFRTALEADAHERIQWNYLRSFLGLEGLLQVHPLLEVPDSLLQGPWTDQMLRHLFYFLRAGARVDSLRTTNSEAAHRGFRCAIKDGRLDVMYLLLRLGIYKDFTDTTILEWAVQNAGGNRLDVVGTVFEMMHCSGFRASWRQWNYMFDRVSAAAQEMGQTEEQRAAQMNWSEHFHVHWLGVRDLVFRIEGEEVDLETTC